MNFHRIRTVVTQLGLSVIMGSWNLSAHAANQVNPDSVENPPVRTEPSDAPPSRQSRELPIEEIEVIGERNLITLQHEINHDEAQMFMMFNELNSTDDFDVRCRPFTRTGSRIAHWECESEFIRKAIVQNTQDAFLGMDPISEEQIWWENRHKIEALNAEMLELAKENPALAKAMLDLHAKRQLLEEIQLRRREKTKDFFRGLFGRDDNERP